MNKKIFALVISLLLCLNIAACSEGGDDVNISDTSAETVTPDESEPETETAAAQTVTAAENTSIPAEIITVTGSETASENTSDSASSSVQTKPSSETAKPVATTTQKPAVTAAPKPVVTTTQKPVVTTAPKPVVTTTQKPVVTTAPKPVVTTTQKPVVTTAPKPVVTTTTAPPSTPSDDYGRRPQTPAEIEFSNRVFELVNEERAKLGLYPFKRMESLSTVANIRAWEQSIIFGHTRPDGKGFSTVFLENGLDYNLCGENVAAGQTTPEEVVNTWMNSPPHRSNIVSTEYVNMEVGYYNIPGSQYTNYWSQNFFKPFD